MNRSAVRALQARIDAESSDATAAWPRRTTASGPPFSRTSDSAKNILIVRPRGNGQAFGFSSSRCLPHLEIGSVSFTLICHCQSSVTVATVCRARFCLSDYEEQRGGCSVLAPVGIACAVHVRRVGSRAPAEAPHHASVHLPEVNVPCVAILARYATVLGSVRTTDENVFTYLHNSRAVDQINERWIRLKKRYAGRTRSGTPELRSIPLPSNNAPALISALKIVPRDSRAVFLGFLPRLATENTHGHVQVRYIQSCVAKCTACCVHSPAESPLQAGPKLTARARASRLLSRPGQSRSHSRKTHAPALRRQPGRSHRCSSRFQDPAPGGCPARTQ